MLLFIRIMIVLLLLVGPAAAAWQKSTLTEYKGYTGEDISVAWDHVPDLTYDLAIVNQERDVQLPLANDFAGISLTFQVPKTGHWKVMVRARRGDEVSEWAESTNPTYATVDGEARGWLLFTWIAPTGPIELFINRKDAP